MKQQYRVGDRVSYHRPGDPRGHGQVVHSELGTIYEIVHGNIYVQWDGGYKTASWGGGHSVYYIRPAIDPSDFICDLDL